MLSLTMNEKEKVRVTGVMAVPKGMQVHPPANAAFYLSLEPGEFDQAAFDSLSDKMQAIIKLSPEYQQLKAPAAPHSDAGGFNDFEDDIPF
jgi:hypothetical protein